MKLIYITKKCIVYSIFVSEMNFCFNFSVIIWLSSGETIDALLSKKSTEKVFTSGGIDVPLNLYRLQEDSKESNPNIPMK